MIPLTWLANELSCTGVGLKTGQMISTGTMTGMLRPKAGQSYRADFGPFGEVLSRLAYDVRNAYRASSLQYLCRPLRRVPQASSIASPMRSSHPSSCASSITPEAMGFVTGIFFVFAAAQLPVGVLLDRYGLRRTMSGLFLIAVLRLDRLRTGGRRLLLAVGRGLMGLGCAAGLYGPLVAISRWFEPARFAPLSSLLYTLGGAFYWPRRSLAGLPPELGWRSVLDDGKPYRPTRNAVVRRRTQPPSSHRVG